MEQFRKNLWNSAAKAGLALGLVSSAYLFINQWTAEIGVPVLTGLLSFVLWAAKFGGCIWLMMFFMKKFVAENQDAVNSDTFRFGVVTALLSAVVYAAFSFANTAYFSADMIAENMDTVMQAYSQFMDSNTMGQMEKMMAKMPQITFFSNLIYCFIFGTILSLILSRNIPSKDPFASSKSDEQ
jgi:hypothetical protein